MVGDALGEIAVDAAIGERMGEEPAKDVRAEHDRVNSSARTASYVRSRTQARSNQIAFDSRHVQDRTDLVQNVVAGMAETLVIGEGNDHGDGARLGGE